MGSFSLIHWVAVILVIILLFGRGRISDLMGDFAKGINSFKKGLNDDAVPPANTPAAPPPQVTSQPASPAPVADEQRR
jgi:sec-independent protein translocase protein TatA